MIERTRTPQPRTSVPPQLALRVAIISGFALVMFAIVFFRLWYLQILTGEQYVQQANANHERQLPIQPPRGEILDRENQPLATSTVTNAVQIVPSDMPAVIDEQVETYGKALHASAVSTAQAAERLKAFERHLGKVAHMRRSERLELHHLRDLAEHVPQVSVPALPVSAVGIRHLFDRLGKVIGLSPRTIDERVVQGMSTTSYANVTIKTNAGKGALTVLAERQNEFPGVTQQPVTIRSYQYNALAAQMLGYVGSVSAKELKRKGFRGVKQGTIVGQGGLEYYYDQWLRGEPGEQHVEVNAAGEPVPAQLAPAQLATTPPKAGYNLKTTIDLPLQREGEKALDQTIEGGVGVGGAFVALDPRNGEVLAMGSYPSFNPNEFDHSLTPSQYDALAGNGNGNSSRLTNRATEGGYPTGSTFKPIAAMGALEAGVITPQTTMGAGLCVQIADECLHNAGHVELGNNNVTGAIKISEDTFFYLVGARANNGLSIQHMAHELGIGEPTGIDLGEITGTVPDAATREELNEKQRECESELHDGKRPHSEPCEISEGTPWTIGNNVNLAVGQGELVTSPLQMAVAYSTLANAYEREGFGMVITPHLGMEIQEPNGGLVQALSFPVRHVHLNYSDLQAVMTGLHEATSEAGGTSADVWSGWDQAQYPVYGKTGTAERIGQPEQAWYICYVASEKRPIVIAVTVEQGGFGDKAAAPIARLIASQWFHKPKTYVAGSNTDQ